MKPHRQSLVTAILGSLLLAGCGAGGSNIAKVNGNAISTDEFHNYLETKNTVRVVVAGRAVELPVADTLAFQAMQDLVAQKLLIQTAKDEGVAPTKEEIDEEIKLRQKLQPGYIQALDRRSLTMGQIRELVELQLAQEKLVTKGIKIGKDELDKTIKENPNIFVEPEKASLELLLVTSLAEREKADQALRSGTGFTAVRGRMDKSPAGLRARFDSTRLSGDGLPINELAEPFKGAVLKTEAGRVTDWMKAGTGWAKIMVHKKTAKKNLEKTPERLKFLERQLAIRQGGKKVDVTKKVSQKLKDSKIEIVDASLKGPWEKFESRLKDQADKTKIPKND